MGLTESPTFMPEPGSEQPIPVVPDSGPSSTPTITRRGFLGRVGVAFGLAGVAGKVGEAVFNPAPATADSQKK